MIPVTKRQQEVFEFIEQSWTQNGYSPTVRDIEAHFGFKSPNGAMCHLKALQRKGLICWERYRSRTIRPIHSADSLAKFVRSEVNCLSPEEGVLFARQMIVDLKVFLDQASASTDGPELEAGSENPGRTADATN